MLGSCPIPRRAALSLALALMAGPGADRLQAAEPLVIRSQSGQFVVSGPAWKSPGTGQTAEAPGQIRLEPPVLTVGLERIKGALLETLGGPDQWRGTIYVSIEPRQAKAEPIWVRSTRHSDKWSYSVSLPTEIERQKLLRVMVEVLLMEMANRHATTSSAELPAWLAPGLTAELVTTTLASFSLQPQSSSLRSQRAFDPLRHAREFLRQRAPLSLDQLNLDPPDSWDDAAGETYAACAQLFVHGLLHFRDGPGSIRAMLACLPEFLNWQTAFLLSFEAHFGRLIDVDKWWSLQVVQATGRDLAATWPLAESWQKLDAALIADVHLRASADQLPVHSQIKLQRVVEEWDTPRQQSLLQQKAALLASLRLRIAEELIGMVDDYRAALEAYLQRGNKTAAAREAKNPVNPPPLRLQAQELVHLLDELDARREHIRHALNFNARPAAAPDASGAASAGSSASRH